MDESSAARKFDPSLEDRRPERAKEGERAKVRQQVAGWIEAMHDPEARRRAAEILIRRRAGRRDLVQFEPIENGGANTLVVAGQLLITEEAFTALDEGQRGLVLDDFKLKAAPVRCLKGRVLQLDVTDGSEQVRGRTTDIVAKLREAGIPVQHSYVTPLGMVRKADGGPEPSAWIQVKPNVPVAGPRVAVIDTGISVEVRGDNWLSGLVRGDNVDLLDVIPQPTDNRLDLGAGHGTFAAGTIQQVAPAADLRIYQTLDTDGVASESAVAAAMVTAAQDGALIVNLSLGTDTLEPSPPISLREAIEQAIAIEPRVLFVCAAGNTGDTRDVYPAAFHQDFPDNVVSVAALKRVGAAGMAGAEWSTHGNVTCSTMGEGVVSTYVIGTETHAADPQGPDTFGANSWATWSGTSFAAPQIVGAIVSVLQDPAHSGLTPRQALDVALHDSTAIADYGRAIVVLPV